MCVYFCVTRRAGSKHYYICLFTTRYCAIFFFSSMVALSQSIYVCLAPTPTEPSDPPTSPTFPFLILLHYSLFSLLVFLLFLSIVLPASWQTHKHSQTLTNTHTPTPRKGQDVPSWRSSEQPGSVC